MGLSDRVEHNSTRRPTSGQLPLPFLTLDDLIAIDAARAAIDQSVNAARAAGRHRHADELEQIGRDLVGILERAAADRRARL